MNKTTSQKGAAPLLVLGIVLLLAGIGLAGWYVWKQNHKADNTKDTTKSSQSTPKSESTPKDQKKEPDPYADWQTYSNATYGISFKFPDDWKVEEVQMDSPESATRQEYAIVLDLKKEFKYNETLSIEVLDQNLSQTATWYDGYYAQSSLNEVSKTHNDLKGRQSIQYNVMNSGELSKLYLFRVGEKTCTFSSLGNTQLDPDFWPKFDKIFESLQIAIP